MALPDYTAWPTASHVTDKLNSAAIEPRTGINPATYYPRILSAVTAEVTKRTHRQFIPATATRYFDGSGTGTLEVDEIISITTVAILGYGALASPFVLSNVYLRQDNTYPSTIIEISQSSFPASTYLYINQFPQGRQNIAVTGPWGYGATIPADLWESACEESAARIAAEAIFDPDGRLQSWKEADATSETYMLQLPGDAASWHTRYMDKIREYTRAVDRNIRKLRPPMI